MIARSGGSVLGDDVADSAGRERLRDCRPASAQAHEQRVGAGGERAAGHTQPHAREA